MTGSILTRWTDTWKPNNSTPSKTGSTTSVSGPPNCGGIFDYDQKADQLKAVALELEDPKVWDDAERAKISDEDKAKIREAMKGKGKGKGKGKEDEELSFDEMQDAARFFTF